MKSMSNKPQTEVQTEEVNQQENLEGDEDIDEDDYAFVNGERIPLGEIDEEHQKLMSEDELRDFFDKANARGLFG
jgi:hypothetical protein